MIYESRMIFSHKGLSFFILTANLAFSTTNAKEISKIIFIYIYLVDNNKDCNLQVSIKTLKI